MIARIWHGEVPIEKAGSYYKYLKSTGLKDYRATNGNLDVKVLRRTKHGKCHYMIISVWDSFESIKKFAGEDFEKAQYYPKDKEYLLEFEETVGHYELVE